MIKSIGRKDTNGVQLHTGDIIAEHKVGDVLWDGSCVVICRPLAVILTNDVSQIRSGVVAFTDNADQFTKDCLADEDGYAYLNFNHYDQHSEDWHNVEKIGSVYDLPY